MLPQLESFRSDESGIKRVIEAYHEYAKYIDVEYVDENQECDLIVSHAGTYPGAQVAINHGLYWTSDYNAAGWEWEMNAQVIKTLRMALEITVPSNWVAETFKRDMRISPTVIGHGIDWEEWQGNKDQSQLYVLWNKNRMSDVCDPTPVAILAEQFPDIHFFTTFYPTDRNISDNVRVSGLLNHIDMKRVIKSSGVYLATTKETWGVGTAEAMASGLPILGFAWGGNLDLVRHGVNGYLAQPRNYQDLAEGLDYCIKHAKVLGSNSRELAKKFTWKEANQKLRAVYDSALKKRYIPPMNKEGYIT
jgi:hypothetical protein